MSKQVKALFVGLNTVDLQFFVKGYPEANTKTKAHRNEVAAGGPATNASLVCAKLGADTTLVSPIGKHSLSRFLSDDIQNHHVKLIDPIDSIESKPVFASIISDELNGERTIFSYHPENSHKKLLEELDIEDLDSFDIVLFDGFYPDLAIPIAKYLQEKGITTVLDGGSWKPALRELLPYIDIAICSNDFFPPQTSSKEDVFKKLKKWGVKEIAITRGEKPILYSMSAGIEAIKIKHTEVVDSLGAGDFFHGAFCYYFACENHFGKALQKASEIASLSCQFHGTRNWLKQLEPTLKD